MKSSGIEAALSAMHRAVRDRVTPGAQLSVQYQTPSGAWEAHDLAVGTLTYAPAAPAVTTSTHYDLASVTKALVALTIVRIATQPKAVFSLDTRLREVLPESQPFPVGERTLAQLLSHRADLMAWKNFFSLVDPHTKERSVARSKLLQAVLSEPAEPSHGHARYSDLGYILLGFAAERATNTPLEALVHKHLTQPLGLTSLAYRPVEKEKSPAITAPTEQCSWRNFLVEGVVHDENAYALGGVAGHAGLFATAHDVALVGRAALEALHGNSQWFSPEAMQAMVQPQPGGTHRLGWDGRAAEGSSAGRYASPNTFGHLGFTGTSLWCDPEKKIAVALLTNRVHPTRETLGIKELRTAVHEGVLGAR